MVDLHTARADYEAAVAFYAERDPGAGERVRDWIAAHPDAADRARRDAAVEQRLARHYRPVLDEPIPPRLLAPAGAPRTPWVTRTAAAVVLVAAGGAGGWWLDLPGEPHAARPTPAPAPAQTTAIPARASTAATGQSDGLDEASLAPDLGERGYRLVSRRRIADAPQALTEFVYAGAGKRVRLYVRPHSPAPDAEPRIAFDAGVPRARWRANGHDYALVGDLAPGVLRELALSVAAHADTRAGDGTPVPQPDARGSGERATPHADVLTAADVPRQM